MLFQRKRSTEHIGALGAAIAAAVAMGISHDAECAIIYSGIMNIPVPVSSSGVYLNVETKQYAGALTPLPVGWDVNVSGTALNSLNFWSGSQGTVYMRAPGDFSGPDVGNLPHATLIGSGGSFSTSPTALFASNVMGHWNYNDENVFGFRFISGTGQIRYGWMRVQVGTDASARAIVDWAYEDTGSSLISGAIPGPAAFSVLGLGGALFGGRRRKG